MPRFADDSHPAPYSKAGISAREALEASGGQPNTQSNNQQNAQLEEEMFMPMNRPAQPKKNPSGKPVVGIIAAVLIAAACIAGICFLIVPKFAAKDTTPTPAQQTQSGNATTSSNASTTSGSGTTSATSTTSGTNKPQSSAYANLDSWELVLVNDENPIPEGWVTDPVEIRDGRMVDSRIADAMKSMIQDCYDAGYTTIFVNQGYRTHADQQAIWDEVFNAYVAQGMTEDEAYEATKSGVAVPGYSEHECGLAADICSYEFDEDYNAPIQSWLAENGWKYGFIQRYPAGKEDITHVKNENWHFRYVGEEAAKEIHDKGWVLEEYVAAHK